jgi:hypothetical protein
VDVHDADVAGTDDTLVLKDVDFGVKVAAALHQIVLLAHDETVAKVFLLDAFDLHAHVVAGLGNVNLSEEKSNAENGLRVIKNARKKKRIARAGRALTSWVSMKISSTLTGTLLRILMNCRGR